MQNVGVAQEIPLAAPHAPAVRDQPDPSKEKELPSPSTATQNDVPLQPTAVKPIAAEMVEGACQDDPSKRATWFWLGAAAQKLAVAHER